MCPMCSGEYADPTSRRFHAQPIACATCGPSVWLVDTRGKQIAGDDPIAMAAAMLLDGKIVAIKGLGGFQIACRADDEHAVARLRKRKRRDAKPFALMAADIRQVESLCIVNDQARELLSGPLRPIVLLPARDDAPIAAPVARGIDTLGVMLPYTPLHHLLFDALGDASPPLVMTSGNFSDEPLVKDNDAAIAHLGSLADAILLHNRKIERRVDDSVVQVAESGYVQVFRRARGYAPQPIRLTAFGSESVGDIPPILAVGAELKGAVCLFSASRAVLGEHVGDLKDGRAYRHFIDTINHLEELFEVTPELLAADLHPGYLSSQYAAKRHRGELAGRPTIPVERVQHHHAHAVSCMAENGRTEPVVAIICDGVGYGDDGAVWGCEILRADLCGYERLGHLRYTPLIGGDAASHETYRPAVAALHDALGDKCMDLLGDLRLSADRDDIEHALEMLAAGVNCPQSSSLGRWFDAVAALCGIADANRFEGEAPMKLESAIHPGVRDAYSFKLINPINPGRLPISDDRNSRSFKNGNRLELTSGPFLIDLRPMVEGIVFDLAGGASAGVVSAKFHNTVARFLASAAGRACEDTNINTVALSGGCFANRHLRDSLCENLRADGLDVLTHRDVPCNDGGVALGQAVVAAARTQTRAELLARDRKKE